MRQAITLAVCVAMLAAAMIFTAAGPASAQVPVDMRAIMAIESSGDPLAFNRATRCYGLYQISEICLEEFNRFHGTAYAPEELFDPGLNERIAGWYFLRIRDMLDAYGIPATIVTVIACYNWGIGRVRDWCAQGGRFEQLPRQTREYIRRYLDLTGAS